MFHMKVNSPFSKQVWKLILGHEIWHVKHSVKMVCFDTVYEKKM